MSVFKIIGTIARVVSDDNGNRVEKTYQNQFRLVRIPGNKNPGVNPEIYKNAARRIISRMAHNLGYVEEDYSSSFVCNDSAINSESALNALPSFSEYGSSQPFDLS